jgi:hypothetical protein
LSPKQAFLLFQRLKDCEAEFGINLDHLDPKNFFSNSVFIHRQQVHEWSSALKKFLVQTMATDHIRQVFESFAIKPSENISQKYQLFNLLLELDALDRLPAIVFILNKAECMHMALYCLKQLKKVEDKPDPPIQKKQKKKRVKEDVKTNEPPEEEPVVEVSHRVHSFTTRSTIEDDNIWIDRLLHKTKWTKSTPIVEALYFGIGIHHGGMPKAYRDCVEAMFREGKLRVVIATGTLAMGINMPCRTVVLCHESKYLSPLMYQQMAGRAGRRGFDTQGHVVFFGIPIRKITTVVCSPLSKLTGTDPLGTTTTLRFLNLYNSTTDPTVRHSVVRGLSLLLKNSLLSFSDGCSGTNGIIHQFVFSCTLLQNLGLADKGLQLIESSAINLLERLHYHDPSNFVLLLLLGSRELEEYVKNIPSKQEAAELLFEVLGHLVNQRKLPNQYMKLQGETNIQLIPLPPSIIQRIYLWNSLLNESLARYISEQKSVLDNIALPLSKIALEHFANKYCSILDSSGENWLHTYGTIVESQLQHPFFAIRGLDDKKSTYFDYTIQIQIPSFALEHWGKFNNYAPAFYKHGSMKTLTKVNFLQDHEAWDLLKDWNLSLKCVNECMQENESKVAEALRFISGQLFEKFSKV